MALEGQKQVEMETTFTEGKQRNFEAVTVEFNDLRLSVRASYARKYGGVGPYIVKTRKKILKDVSGEFRPGELTAILGPSGAGKSSLLNVLAGFKDHDKTGKIYVNGKPRKRAQFRKMSCYIMQYDEVLPCLTIMESMRYAAQLKLPLRTSAAERDSVILDILDTIGLTSCKDTRAAMLSGGQRKRLAIAFELINNPPVMFFDEPTSGLDSVSCLSCVALLKTLAQGGRTIIATIHQPSARILEYFDSLYLLAEGDCIYRGPVRSLVPYFAKQGLRCPAYHNPADFAIEVAIGSYGDHWIQMLSKATEMGCDSHSSGLAHDCCDSENSLDDKELDGPSGVGKIIRAEENPALRYGDTEATSTKDPHAVVCLLPNKDTPFGDKLKYGGHEDDWRIRVLSNEFMVLLRRSFVAMQRDTLLVKIRFAAVFLVAVLVGIIFPESGKYANRAINNAGNFFFGLVFTIFCSIMTAVLTIPLERNVIVREHMNSWYSLKSYFASKMFAEIPHQVFFPTMYTTMTYLLTQQPLEWWRYGIVLYFTIMLSLASQAVGFLIGAAFNVQNAVILGAVSTVPFLLFTGFITTIGSIPAYARWFAYLSYPRYAFQSAMMAVYGFGRENLLCTEAYCHFKSPKKILEQFDIAESSVVEQAIAILVLTIAVRLASYWVLKIRIRLDKAQ